MSRKNNEDALSGRDRAQSQPSVVPAPGDVVSSPDAPDASGQTPSASVGGVSHAGVAPAADPAADAVTVADSDVPDASGQAPSASVGGVSHAGAAPAAEFAAGATAVVAPAALAAEKTAASKGFAPDGKPARTGAPKKSRFRTARGWVAFACVAFALAGMAFRVGIGTPSAFGIQQISAICPLGALETMAGAKGVMLHPLLLFVLVVVLIALVGKAFCAWMCPVPWLQKFFRPRKRGAAKGEAGHDTPMKSGVGHNAWAKADTGCEASGLGGAGHDASASCDNSDAGSAQAGPSTSGVAEAREPQIGTASGASYQKTRECVSVAGGECANDAHGVTTAASKCAAEELAGGCGSGSLDSARTRAIFGSNNTEPAGKQAACSSSASASAPEPACSPSAAGAVAAAEVERAGGSRQAYPVASELVAGFESAPTGRGAASASSASACAFASVSASELAAASAPAGASASAAACSPSACAACSGAKACAKALAPVGGKRDGLQLDSRHAVLVGTLASAAVFGFPVFCLICPVGLTFATIIGLWNLVQFNEPSWALVIFPVILILEVTVLRKWCSKICPISALVSLLSNLNVTLRPRVKTDVCLRSRGVDCHACVDACPEQLDPHSKRIPECSKCGKCVDACPAKAISIKLLK